jgi:hypothetical protein
MKVVAKCPPMNSLSTVLAGLANNALRLKKDSILAHPVGRQFPILILTSERGNAVFDMATRFQKVWLGYDNGFLLYF